MRGMTAELLQSSLFVITGITLILITLSHEGVYALIAIVALVLYLIVGVIGVVDAVVLKEKLYAALYEKALQLQTRLHWGHRDGDGD